MTKNERCQERVVRIQRPLRHYCLLRAPKGDYLGISNSNEGVLDHAELGTFDHVDDGAIWEDVTGDNAFRHVVTGLTVRTDADFSRDSCHLRHDGVFLGSDGAVSEEGALFTVEHGPADLPSEYLRTFNENGWVCLPAILDADVVEELERVSCTGRWSDSKYDTNTSLLNQSAAVGRAAAEPVSLWLLRQYLQTNDIRFAHAPGVVVLGKDDGKRDVQGLHSDFPYLWGITGRVGGDRVPIHTSGDLVMAVQRNTCITEFTRDNGATCFKLGSHKLNEGPPKNWGIGSDYSERGYREAQGLPYGGPEADVIEAPAGSIILYDARTWHRAGVNRTDQKRAAILQAVTPMYIMPFIDMSQPYKAFVNGPFAPLLTERERKDIEKLMVHKIVGPGGQYAITIDEELSRIINS